MDEEVETPKPSKVKQILPLAAMLLLGLGGGAGATWFLAPPGDGEESEETDAADAGHGEAAAKEEEGGGHGEAEKAEGGHGEAAAGGHGAPAKEEAGGHGAPAESGGHGEAKAAEGGHGGGEAKHSAKAEPPADGSGTITNLGTFTINLRGSGGGRILRLEVQVDAGEEGAESIKSLTPRIRDSVIAVVSDYTWSELEGTDGKTRLKDELLTRINGITDPVTVRSVYLTNFVVS